MTKSSSRNANRKQQKTILLGVTGSIASYKACDLINRFRERGFAVKCAMSRDAKWFITPLTLETLTGEKVAEDMFRLPATREPAHIALSEEADIILVAPATADIIAKTASGICDDILTCAVCSSRCPVVFAPAMNDRMYNNPIIQDRITYLRGKGYHFVGPVVGRLACGYEGMGHLAPADKIIERVESLLE